MADNHPNMARKYLTSIFCALVATDFSYSSILTELVDEASSGSAKLVFISGRSDVFCQKLQWQVFNS